MFELSPHGVDVHVGTGPQYPWGGLYGGQIIAQALRAATLSSDDGFEPHSIRAYFIRRGNASEPVRYEVERIRNGRSFQTRRVVARQAIGAILNAEASFQRPEESETIQTCSMPEVPGPAELEPDSWSPAFERATVPADRVGGAGRDGAGRTVVWMRTTEPIGERDDADSQLLHRCWLAYLSDDLPTEAVVSAHPMGRRVERGDAEYFAASLDHTMWFHRPVTTDGWHLHDVSCHHFVGGRGLAVGHVFDPDGTHVATISQEVLLREVRDARD